jgi:hypothetical protein
MPYSKGLSARGASLPQVRKLVVASVGLGLLVASTVFGQDVTDASDEVLAVFDGAVALLTALGVYQVPNDPPQPPTAERSDWGRDLIR